MPDTITDRVLTTQDARALRNADAIAFIHSGVGTGGIRAIVRAENSPTGYEQTHLITARMSTLETYGPPVEDVRGFHLEMNVKVVPHMQTIIRAMRAGKQFTLKWVRDNNNQNYPKVGYHRDELRIRIGDDKRADEYLVAVYVGPDNTARMTTGL
jgi:hypothetical protein